MAILMSSWRHLCPIVSRAARRKRLPIWTKLSLARPDEFHRADSIILKNVEVDGGAELRQRTGRRGRRGLVAQRIFRKPDRAVDVGPVVDGDCFVDDIAFDMGARKQVNLNAANGTDPPAADQDF